MSTPAKVNHSIIAQSFHHQYGYKAKLITARQFAGQHGYIATMEDLINVALKTKPLDDIWRLRHISSSFICVGNIQEEPHILVVHLDVASLLPQCVFIGYFQDGFLYDPTSFTLSQEVFNRLAQMPYAVRIPAEQYEKYHSQRQELKRSQGICGNKLTYKDLENDLLMQAFFGKHAKEYFNHLNQSANEHFETVDNKDVIIVREHIVSDIFSRYRGLGKVREDGKPRIVGPMALDPVFAARDEKNNRHTYHVEIGIGTEDQAYGCSAVVTAIHRSCYFEEISEIIPHKIEIPKIVMPFMYLLGKMYAHWQYFVEPTPKLEDKESSITNPPHILGAYFTQEDSCSKNNPKLFVRSGKEGLMYCSSIKKVGQIILKNEAIKRSDTARSSDEELITKDILANLPSHANAYHRESCEFIGDNANYTQSQVGYYNVELDTRPLYILQDISPKKDRSTLFTQYLDKHRNPSAQPQHPITRATLVKKMDRHSITNSFLENVPIITSIRMHLPAGANAVLLDILSTHDPVMLNGVEFYHVEVDETRQFRPLDELQYDFDWYLSKLESLNLI